MGDWPTIPIAATPEAAISPHSIVSVGSYLILTTTTQQPASTAWPAANRALFIPFRLSKPFLITQAVVGCGGTSGGNFDVGVYDQFGNLIVASGATTRNNSVENVVGLTDTLIGPGVFYMALAADGTNNYLGQSPAQVGLTKAAGIKEMESAYTLPATATYATVSSAFWPSFSIWGSAF